MTDSKTTTITYAVWIAGQGWLRNPQNANDIFADTSNVVAQGAANLYGEGARVTPFDDDLLKLEPTFIARDLERERQRQARTWRGRLANIRGIFR